VEWNRTEADFPHDRMVHDLIAERARERPGALAVATPERILSYGDLDAQANRLAHRLRRLGVGPEARVAVCLPHSTELVVSLLGVLRAGGAYVPIDPGHPRERAELVLKDSGARVLLTLPQLAATFARVEVPVLAIDPWCTLAAANPSGRRWSRSRPGTWPT